MQVHYHPKNSSGVSNLKVFNYAEAKILPWAGNYSCSIDQVKKQNKTKTPYRLTGKNKISIKSTQ